MKDRKTTDLLKNKQNYSSVIVQVKKNNCYKSKQLKNALTTHKRLHQDYNTVIQCLQSQDTHFWFP